MARLRLRFSLLSALMATAVIALSIIAIRQHRELSTLRYRWDQLPSYWKARPRVLDDRKMHARSVVDIEALLWTWRLWVPVDAKIVARFKWGDISAEGFPADARSIELSSGDNWLALKLEDLPVTGETLGQIFGPDSVNSFVVPGDERLFPWHRPEYESDVIGSGTLIEDDEGRLLLQRFRVVDDKASDAATAKGFIIWLERR